MQMQEWENARKTQFGHELANKHVIKSSLPTRCVQFLELFCDACDNPLNRHTTVTTLSLAMFTFQPL
jgi:hypothetical protein